MSNRLMSLLTVLVVSAGLLVSCVPVPMEDLPSQQAAAAPAQRSETTPLPTTIAAATTAPIAAAKTAATAVPTATTVFAPTSTPRVQPTATSKPSDTPVPTNTASPRPTARSTDTPQPTRTVAPTPSVAPTPTAAPALAAAAANPNLIVITEDDIAQAVAEGAGAQQGAKIENLNVRFTDGKVTITAGKIGYGLINLQNLNLVGRLVAKNGVLSLEVESISPRGLVSNFIPTMANQALAQYGANWYVEDVQILDGRVELRIR
jgi:hypothetical protein